MNLKEEYRSAKYKFQRNSPWNMDILKKAFENVNGCMETDFYGKGDVIENFEKKFAEILGKEAAVFMPSGTMAQQIALRIYADKQNCKKVAYHPLSHLEIREKDAIKVLHNLQSIKLGDANRLFTLEDLMSINEKIGTLLIELPQREIGGVLPTFEQLESIVKYAKSKGMFVHLDGARLLESLPYYKKTASEIAELFDSVYISFYKGIGAVAGAILAGSKELIEESKVWKRRFGGDLISLYPYIIPADYYYENRKDKMMEFHLNAKKLAELFNDVSFIHTEPKVPMTNMFHVYVEKNKDELEKIFSRIYKELDLSISDHIKKRDESVSKFEISIGEEFSKIPYDLIERVFSILKEYE